MGLLALPRMLGFLLNVWGFAVYDASKLETMCTIEGYLGEVEFPWPG